MNTTKPTFEKLKQDDKDEEEEDDDDELEEEEPNSSDEESEETPKWDSFKDYRNESESISMVDNSFVDISIQIFKIFAYLLTFSMVLLGAVFSKSVFLLMTSQLTPNKTVTVKTGSLFLELEIPTVERYLWIWALLICFAIPELGVLFRSARKTIFKGYVNKDDFGSETEDPSPLSFKSLIVFILMEALHVVGTAIFVFEILPQIDVAKGVMLTNCMCLIPGLLTVISSIKPFEVKKLKIYVDILAVLFQITGLIAWPILLGADQPRIWILPVSLVLISCGWWMNYVSDESSIGLIKFLANIKDTLKKREVLLYKLYIWISVFKILLFFGCTLVILMLQGVDILDFFNRTSEAFGPRLMNAKEVDMVQMTYTGFSFSIPSINGNVWWIIGAQVFSTYICYIFGKFACRVMIQPFSFAFPCALAVPASIVFIVITTGLRNENLTIFESILPGYLFFNSPQIYDASEFFIYEFGWVWILWVISQIYITFHIWSPRCERLSKAEKLFTTPLYSEFLIDQSISLNRRRDTVETREKYQSPHIIACATMWHETRPEMLEMLKSILRMDNDQCLKQSAMKNDMNDPEAAADYYTFESHIFFDDAFELEDEESNKTVINGFVKDFLKTIKKAKDGIYGSADIQIKAPLKYSTPYGGRLEYTLPGENKLYIHLKDKDKIRHKKRWSQVMYMYYLLGYKLAELPIPYEKIQEKAENTFILALDGDIDFKPDAVILLIDLMKKNKYLGAACGRIHPVGSGLMVWYQLFEYAIGHWLQKATEHTIGCVLCSPGCFSLFRAKALMSPNVMKRYTTKAEEPLHYVQYDQGEDRWLCTLLLQRGYRVEYSAASDAYTHCPETFKEFYTQRRRWIPSTVANIVDLLKDYKRTVRVNNDISLLYIAYQMLLLLGSILGPGTILLMLVGAFNAAFKIDNWTALYFNLLPISIFIICCLFTSQNFQIATALLISLFYGLVMMAVLVGIAMEIKDDGVLSPSSLFLFITAGEIIIAGLLHPQEILCLFCGVIYYVTIPSMYLLLIIYAVCNLNVVSWGTREVKSKKTKAELEKEKKEAEIAEKKAQKTKLFGIFNTSSGNKEKEESGTMELSFSNFFRCLCCISEKPNQAAEQFIKIGETLNVLKSKLDNIEKGQIMRNNDMETVQIRRPTIRNPNRPENITPIPSSDNVLVKGSETMDEDEMRDELFNPYWIENKHLKHSKFEVLSTSEIQFWRDLIKNYLSPLVEDEEKQKKVKASLKELRDKMVVTFFMLNALFVVVIFLLQTNKDQIHIKWPLEAKANITFNPVTYEITICKMYLQLEPVGLTFITFFASILIIQFISMLFHRFETLCHLISSTQLTILRRNKALSFREKLELAKKRFNKEQRKKTETLEEISRIYDDAVFRFGETPEKRKSKLKNLDQEYTEILNEMREENERKEAERIERRRSSLWGRLSYQNHRISKVASFSTGMDKITEEF